MASLPCRRFLVFLFLLLFLLSFFGSIGRALSLSKLSKPNRIFVSPSPKTHSQCSSAPASKPNYRNSAISGHSSRGGRKSCLYSLLSSEVVSQYTRTAAKRDNIAIVLKERAAMSYFGTKPSVSSIPVPWSEVFEQIQTKMGWEDKEGGEKLSLKVYSLDDQPAEVDPADVVVMIDLTGEKTFDSLATSPAMQGLVSSARAVALFGCEDTFKEAFEKYGDGLFDPSSPFEPIASRFDRTVNRKSIRSKYRQSYEISQEMWARRSCDDLLFMCLVLIDSFSTPVDAVKAVSSTDNTSLGQVGCMVSRCRDEMVGCLTDETCKKALDCLNACKGNDQVCSYRCITSHETPEFEKFARCILQKNNCMQNSAEMPRLPDPVPLQSFRGQTLNHEVAEAIFIGHLDAGEGSDDVLGMRSEQNEPWSWKVVCGQNPAYDYFSCQHQIFYRDINRKSVMWYDPVFKVRTIYGKDVWRRRHYRVRRAKVPGQFFFSVLDNGVVSNENWRILDCADDMSWAVFYYSGAASAAGTNYRGALIVSRDGNWPEMTPKTSQRIETAMGKGDIKMWELYEVNNRCCDGSDTGPTSAGPPPLGIRPTSLTSSLSSEEEQ